MVDFLQAGITALFAVVVYVIGQLITTIFIEPVNELRIQIGKTSDTLILYNGIYTNPKSKSIPVEKKRETVRSLQEQASYLFSKANMVLWYCVSSKIRLLPSKNNMKEACDQLRFISNSMFSDRSDSLKIEESRKKILRCLNLAEW